MTFSFPKITFSIIAVAALTNCGSAYARGTIEEPADSKFGAASEALALPTAIVAANRRETNLRKTASTIVVLGLGGGKSDPKSR